MAPKKKKKKSTKLWFPFFFFSHATIFVSLKHLGSNLPLQWSFIYIYIYIKVNVWFLCHIFHVSWHYNLQHACGLSSSISVARLTVWGFASILLSLWFFYILFLFFESLVFKIKPAISPHWLCLRVFGYFSLIIVGGLGFDQLFHDFFSFLSNLFFIGER